VEISLGTNILEGGTAKQLSSNLLKILADGGVRLVDLHVGACCNTSISSCKVTNRFLDYTNETRIARVKAWLAELDIKPICMHSACCYPLDPSHSNEDLRKFSVGELRMCLTAAGEFGIPIMVVHAGDKIEDGTTVKEKLTHLRKSIEELLPAARNNKVRLALENIYYPGSLFCRLKDLVDFVNKVGDERVGICLDTGHFNLVDGHSVTEGVLKAAGKLYALHLHDNDGVSDQHLPPSNGNINWDGFTTALQRVGYCGTLNLEIRRPENEADLTPAFVRELLNRTRNLFDK